MSDEETPKRKLRRGLGNRTSSNIKDDIAQAEREKRKTEVFKLRVGGMLFRDIAQRVGVSLSQAWHDFKEAQKEIPAQERADMVALVNARMDGLVEAHYPGATDGKDHASAKVVLEATKVQVTVNGLAAPTKHELTGKDGAPIETVSVTHDDLLSRLSRLASAGGEGTDRPEPEPSAD